jgi:hypothetical protein
MHIDLEKGDKINHARVVMKFYRFSDTPMVGLEPSQHTDEGHLIREMAQIGWTHYFTANSTGWLWFQKANGEGTKPRVVKS